MENFGDDLFVDALTSLDPHLEAHTVFLCPPIDGVSARFAYPRFLKRAYQREDVIGSVVRAIFGVLWYLWCTDIVVAGGSVLSDLNGTRRLQYRMNRALPRRWTALGVSIGPFGHQAARVKVERFLRLFDVIYVRDRASAAEIEQFELQASVAEAGDLAMLRQYPAGVESSSTLLLIPCSSLDVAWHLGVVDAVVTLLRRHPNIEVGVASVNSHREVGDDGLVDLMVRRFAEQGVAAEGFFYRQLGISGVIDKISQSRWVFSARLHGGIVAFACGNRAVTVEYHRKVTDFVLSAGIDADLRCGPSASDVQKSLTALVLGCSSGNGGGLEATRHLSEAYVKWAREATRRQGGV